MDKKVLDVCCGSKMFYFDKDSPFVHYNDIRNLNTTLCDGRKLIIKPDTNFDFTNLKFESNQFKLVVFDPPHLVKVGDNSWLAKKYGKLPEDWAPLLKAGFDECMRVLEEYGILIFKWNETDIKSKDIFNCFGKLPLLGDKSRTLKTHWYIFIKD